MQRRLLWCAILAAGGVLLASSWLRAAEPTEAFDYLYGTEAKRVLADKDPKAPADFAARLMADADSTLKAPTLKTIAYQKAYEFGIMNALGYATAVDAMQHLIATVPERDAEWQEKLLAVLQLEMKAAKNDEKRQRLGPLLVEQYVTVAELQVAAGSAAKAGENCRQAQAIIRMASADRKDALQDRIKQVEAKTATLVAVDQAKGQLQADPKNKVASEKLVRLYLVELDNPTEAAKYAELGADELTRRCILVADMNPENLPENALLMLTEWYKNLADSASGEAKAAMLRRASSFGEQYLKAHTADDLSHTKVATLMTRVTADLTAATDPPPAAKLSPDKTPVKIAPKVAAKPPAGPPKLPIRVNCGGAEITDAKGVTWLADQPYATGKYWGYYVNSTKANHLDDPDLPPLYLDERVGMTIIYRFDLPVRKYTVKLGFFDDTSKAAGDRPMAISVQDLPVEKSFDIFKYNGGKRKVLDLTINHCSVINGILIVRLTGLKQVISLSSIQVTAE
jgi:hypothetical protein